MIVNRNTLASLTKKIGFLREQIANGDDDLATKRELEFLERTQKWMIKKIKEIEKNDTEI